MKCLGRAWIFLVLVGVTGCGGSSPVSPALDLTDSKVPYEKISPMPAEKETLIDVVISGAESPARIAVTTTHYRIVEFPKVFQVADQRSAYSMNLGLYGGGSIQQKCKQLNDLDTPAKWIGGISGLEVFWSKVVNALPIDEARLTEIFDQASKKAGIADSKRTILHGLSMGQPTPFVKFAKDSIGERSGIEIQSALSRSIEESSDFLQASDGSNFRVTWFPAYCDALLGQAQVGWSYAAKNGVNLVNPRVFEFKILLKPSVN